MNKNEVSANLKDLVESNSQDLQKMKAESPTIFDAFMGVMDAISKKYGEGVETHINY